MSAEAEFAVTVDQNAYLSVGATRVDAVVSVTATGDATPAVATEALEMLIIDTSGSMQGDRIASARTATAVAIEQLRDGVLFAVISGATSARQVYPKRGAVRADAGTRAEAVAAVRKLSASGGTAFSNWLTLARQIAEQHPGAIRHALLLTDGENGDGRGVLEQAIEECVGVFSCDCRGIGTDWKVAEVRKIASALLGTVDIVANPENLAADFHAIMNSAMGKRVADVSLRLWTPKGAQVKFVKQVAPEVEDLTAKRVQTGPLHGDYPLGAWGAESREYHVCVEVLTQAVGAEMLACRAMVVRGGSAETLAQGLIRAVWTDDDALSAKVSRKVAHYTGQSEYADAVEHGLAARRDGDERTATARLGRAVALATAAGDREKLDMLAKVVDVDDAATGTVRLKSKVSNEAEMELDIRSRRTSRIRGEG
ncbi:VWA domain-containing protein [Saccharothrix sp. NRRL B-16314]|uniref:VWA domain-containing protein n=1 Tax=Saccharothrix sp. NRRL B-16314 TaxID=1463825 RepID=UPI000527D80C|nr:VWA domain-containing protein [Saccharothrix sp. NRRL B-16314]